MIHGVSIQTTMNTHALWHTVAFHRNLQHTSVIPWALRWKQQQPCDRLSKQSACGIRSEQRGATDGRAHKFVFSCSHVTGGGTFVVCLRPFVYDGSQQTSSLWTMVVYFGTTSTESEVQVREQSCRINVSQTFEQVAGTQPFQNDVALYYNWQLQHNNYLRSFSSRKAIYHVCKHWRKVSPSQSVLNVS